jgi:uncharacterized protein (TIGR00162 family)
MPAWTRISLIEEPKLKDPILVQGLPGLGFVGKLIVSYLVDEFELKPFAELHSTYLILPDGSTGIYIKPDGTYFLPKFEFYAYNQTAPNVIFLTGDSQPNVQGQYEVTQDILDFVHKYGCKRIISVGGFQTPIEKDLGQVYGVFNKPSLGKELKNLGVNNTRSGTITGSCGVVLGLSSHRNLDAIGLLGATTGEYPDMQAAKSVIQVLAHILGIKVNYQRIDDEISKMETKLEILKKLQAESPHQLKKEEEKQPFYI